MTLVARLIAATAALVITSCSAAAMDFRLAPDYRTVFASGVVDGSSTQRFESFVQSHVLNSATGITVVLDSPGGRLDVGVTLGQAIRSRKWDTAVGAGRFAPNGTFTNVPGTCASACVLAYLGGIRRQLRAEDRLGVHQFGTSAQNESTKDTYVRVQRTLSALMSYVRTMGADVQLIETASAVRPESMRWLTTTEAKAWNVVTWEPSSPITTGSITRVPSSEAAAPRVCPAPDGPVAVIGVPEWDHLNVRSEPRTSSVNEPSNVIAKLPSGTPGISLVDDCSLSDWCRVRIGCIEGYASKTYLGTGSASPRPIGGQVAGLRSIGTFFVRDVMPGDLLNVREAPSASSAIVTTIPHNETRVDVSQCGRTRADGVWCFVTYRGRMGWARAAYLLSTDGRLPPRVDLVLEGSR